MELVETLETQPITNHDPHEAMQKLSPDGAVSEININMERASEIDTDQQKADKHLGDEAELEGLVANASGPTMHQANQHHSQDDETKEEDDDDGRVFRNHDFQAEAFPYIKSEHEEGCDGQRCFSTPPPSPKRGSGPCSDTSILKSIVTGVKESKYAPPTGPYDVIVDRDVSKNLLAHRRFHMRAYLLVPRIELPKHRYWIAVLHKDRQPEKAREEKHFVWMRGNRLTTVQTVARTYATTTFTEDFVLLLGYEKVTSEQRMEQLDYFDDKFICFRAVHPRHEHAKGREITQGLIPQVVSLLDDDGD